MRTSCYVIVSTSGPHAPCVAPSHQIGHVLYCTTGHHDAHTMLYTKSTFVRECDLRYMQAKMSHLFISTQCFSNCSQVHSQASTPLCVCVRASTMHAPSKPVHEFIAGIRDQGVRVTAC